MHALNNNILVYLKDTNFLRYVFEGTASQLKYWRGYMARKPAEKENILKAKYLLLHLDEMECSFTKEEIESLKKRIADSLNKENR